MKLAFSSHKAHQEQGHSSLLDTALVLSTIATTYLSASLSQKPGFGRVPSLLTIAATNQQPSQFIIHENKLLCRNLPAFR